MRSNNQTRGPFQTKKKNKNYVYISESPHVRESKTVLDSGFHTVDSGFQVLDSSICQWNLDSGFQSLLVFRIPWAVIPDSKEQDSGFHRQNFPAFWIQSAKISRIPLHQQLYTICLECSYLIRVIKIYFGVKTHEMNQSYIHTPPGNQIEARL